MRATCRYCYGYGHNKMGCPKAKADANDKNRGDGTLSPMQQYDKWVKDNPEDDHPCVYKLRREFDWDYEIKQAVEIQLEKRKRSRATKVCNFCGETGHNKRTCPEIKAMKKRLAVANSNYRQAVLQTIIDRGMGIGGVISGKLEYYDKIKSEWRNIEGIALVQNIDWDRVSLWDVDTSDHGKMQMFNGVSHTIFRLRWSNGQTENVSLVGEQHDLFRRNWGNPKKMISPSTQVLPPEGWLTSEDATTQARIASTFKGRKAPALDEFYQGSHWDSIIKKWTKNVQNDT